MNLYRSKRPWCLRRLVVTQVTNARRFMIKQIYDGFHHLVTDNLQWWERNGLLERSAISIEEKVGGQFQNRYVGFIDCNCLRTDLPGGGPLGDGPGSLIWSNDRPKIVL